MATSLLDITGFRAKLGDEENIETYLQGHTRAISYDLPASEYFAIEAFSSSSIDALLHSPAHYRAWKDEERKQTPAKTLGELIHQAILEPARFDAATGYWVEPERERRTNGSRVPRTPDQKAALATMVALGKLIVEQEDVTTARNIGAGVHAHPLAHELLLASRPEVTLLTRDPETNAPMKARIDALVLNSRAGAGILDVKSTADASHDEFARSAASYGYHSQAFHYWFMHNLAFDCDPNFYAWLACETSAPYGVQLFMAQADCLNAGRDRAMSALTKYSEATIRGEWFGYSQLATPLQLPRWALSKPMPQGAPGGEAFDVVAKEKPDAS